VAQQPSALGDYLRARREQLRPEDVGMAPGTRRRVAGLRREELAILAGISVAYYLRLEQGRVTNPSEQVLNALARALQLDAIATRHLHTLTSPAEPATSDEDAAAYAFADVIDQFLMPAVLVNRYRDVLAANALARALSPEFTPGQNLLRWRLLEPAAREYYADWDEATEIVVSGLRQLSGSCPMDPSMRQLILELSDASPRFRELWDRADVGDRLGVHHVHHPIVGDLYLHRHKLLVPYPGGDHVLMYRAEADSDSARKLDMLRTTAGAPVAG
jgi:transcriptional regulator with XRE-family HTH domain